MGEQVRLYPVRPRVRRRVRQRVALPLPGLQVRRRLLRHPLHRHAPPRRASPLLPRARPRAVLAGGPRPGARFNTLPKTGLKIFPKNVPKNPSKSTAKKSKK